MVRVGHNVAFVRDSGRVSSAVVTAVDGDLIDIRIGHNRATAEYYEGLTMRDTERNRLFEADIEEEE